MYFKILYLEDSDEWKERLNQLPVDLQDIYFTPEYYKIAEQNEEGKAICFCYNDDNNIALYPFLLNSINNLGYKLNKEYYDIQGAYGYNGILSNISDKGIISKFNGAFTEYCLENNIIAGFTRFHPLLKNETFSSDINALKKDREVVAIDLRKEYSEIWNSDYSSKCRNMIRKADKLGYNIQVLSNPSDEDIDKFIEIYYHSMQMANAEKYYYFNRNYFINTFKYLKNNSYLINVINNENIVVCSSIFYQFGDYFHYHLSGRNVLSDNSVNNFLIDRVVDFAKKKGAKLLHLGGGRTASVDDTLFLFKKNFSKLLLPFYYEKNIYNNLIYQEVVDQWEFNNPEKVDKYKNYLLKYRL